MKTTHVHPFRLLAVPLLGLAVALLLMLGWGHGISQHAAANDPGVDFKMEVKTNGTGGCSTDIVPEPTAKGDVVCFVPVNGSFDVSIQLIALGGATGSADYVQMALQWTAGLTGPFDSPSKLVSVSNCSGTTATAAPFLGVPHTAASACVALPLPFTDAQALAARTTFEMNCSSTPSQQLITMRSEQVDKKNFTLVGEVNPQVDHSEGADEVITINCVPPPPPDKDGDGIADDVDTQPNVFSDDFSDLPGGITTGTILTRGSFDVNVTDARNPAGVRVTTKGTGFSAAALIRLDCSPVIEIAGVGFDMVLSCGSAIIDVLSGPVSATFAGIKVEIPAGAQVTVEEVSPGTFTVTNASTSSTSITVDGLEVPPDEIAKLLGGFPPIVVGGLVVDLDGDLGDLPLETPGSSGSNTGLIAGIVAAIAAAVALGGAAWYARRRLLR